MDNYGFNQMNHALRRMARKSRVPQWMIAREMHISESTLTRMLRRQLTDSEFSKIYDIIHKFKR